MRAQPVTVPALGVSLSRRFRMGPAEDGEPFSGRLPESGKVLTAGGPGSSVRKYLDGESAEAGGGFPMLLCGVQARRLPGLPCVAAGCANVWPHSPRATTGPL